jgi:hypothetical protein
MLTNGADRCCYGFAVPARHLERERQLRRPTTNTLRADGRATAPTICRPPQPCGFHLAFTLPVNCGQTGGCRGVAPRFALAVLTLTFGPSAVGRRSRLKTEGANARQCCASLRKFTRVPPAFSDWRDASRGRRRLTLPATKPLCGNLFTSPAFEAHAPVLLQRSQHEPNH